MFEAFALIIAVYCIVIFSLRRSDTGNGKKKNIAGWMLFGLMWPKMKEQIERDSKNSEMTFISMLIMFMGAAIVVVYLVTHGKLSF